MIRPIERVRIREIVEGQRAVTPPVPRTIRIETVKVAEVIHGTVTPVMIGPGVGRRRVIVHRVIRAVMGKITLTVHGVIAVERLFRNPPFRGLPRQVAHRGRVFRLPVAPQHVAGRLVFLPTPRRIFLFRNGILTLHDGVRVAFAGSEIRGQRVATDRQVVVVLKHVVLQTVLAEGVEHAVVREIGT